MGPLPQIAVVTGGYSHEKIVSLKSVQTLIDHLDTSSYAVFKVVIDELGWYVHVGDRQYRVNKNDFSFEDGTKTIKFDFAFITIHGTPGEDGRLQAYFDLVGVPYSTPSYLASTITSNKFVCNSLLRTQNFKCAQAMLLRQNQQFHPGDVAKTLGLPCFVKPVDGGSSFGVTKVKELSEMEPAIALAFEHGSEVMIEAFVSGIEVTCGVFMKNGEVEVLSITEIVSGNDFFDFEAKYQGKSEEITPARLPQEVFDKIKSLTRQAYLLLGLKGMSRIDYIVQDGEPYLIEVNTTPGLSAQSIIPQQVRHVGYSLQQFFDWCIQASLKD